MPTPRPGAAGVATAAVLALASAVPLALTAGSTAAGAAATPASTTPGRPNIVFVLADDLGWADLHTGLVNNGHGNDFDDTPALDRLAAQGMTFDNAYACLNCAPSRMALMTGLYATHPENNVYVVGDLNRGTGTTLLVGPAQGRANGDDALDPASTTVAETLQGAGYRTGYVGKFHVTQSPAQIVSDHGFDENFGGTGAGFASQYFASGGQFNASVGPELDQFAANYTQSYVDQFIAPYSTGVSQAQLDALVGTPKHVSDAVADATLDFIDRNDDQPFLAWMATYAVHSPTNNKQARPDLLAKYQAKPAGTSPSVPSYASLVESVDQSVARVVDHLETTPDPRNPGHVLADNTVVVFTSDNGGRLADGADNGPLRGQKGELYEGGVRVPWIVWSANPTLVDGGTVNHSVINSTDLYPTLASYAGASLPAGVPFDGTDLTGAFADDTQVNRPRFAHLPGYLTVSGRDQTPQSWVRDGRWKLTYGYEDQFLDLTDLTTDIGESVNAAAANPTVTHRLGLELLDWLDSTDAPLATLRSGHAPLRLTVPAGDTYANGAVQHHATATTVTIQPGQEVPFVLPS